MLVAVQLDFKFLKIILGGKPMKKISILPVLFFALFSLNSSIAFGQGEINQPLSANPIFFIAPLAPIPVSFCEDCRQLTEKKEKIKESSHLFYVDMPVSFQWKTVDFGRIEDWSIQKGGQDSQWISSATVYKWPLVPRVGFMTEDLRLKAEGGLLKINESELLREMKQVDGSAEGNIWYFLLGGEVFFAQERIRNSVQGLNFDADFKRESFGGTGWEGAKVGSFNKNYITGRYGRGYMDTTGFFMFNVPGVDGLEWIDFYVERFRTTSFLFDGQLKTRWIGQSVLVKRTEYERFFKSPDESRYGKNNFRDVIVRGETEILVLPKRDLLRVVVVGSMYFGDNQWLMFKNDHHSVAVFLRVAFK